MASISPLCDLHSQCVVLLLADVVMTRRLAIVLLVLEVQGPRLSIGTY